MSRRTLVAVRVPFSGTLWLLAAAAVLGVPGPLAAQAAHKPDPWAEEVAIGAANAALAGVAAAITAWLRGQDVGEAMLGGFVGGSIVFAGKRLAVEDRPGIGFAGRQLAAVGSSVARNAAEARPWLQEVWLPLGPVWIDVRSGASGRVSVDLWGVGALVWGVTRAELAIDWRATLSNGAFVFDSPSHDLTSDGEPINGFAYGGIVVLGPTLTEGERSQVRGHEMVHVIQQDYYYQAWSRPMESWAWRRFLNRDVPFQLGIAGRLLLPPFMSMLGESEAELMEAR
jgi:hypothetical protein